MRNPLANAAISVNENDILSNNWFEKFAGNAPMSAPKKRLHLINIDSRPEINDSTLKHLYKNSLEIKPRNLTDINITLRYGFEMLTRGLTLDNE